MVPTTCTSFNSVDKLVLWEIFNLINLTLDSYILRRSHRPSGRHQWTGQCRWQVDVRRLQQATVADQNPSPPSLEMPLAGQPVWASPHCHNRLIRGPKKVYRTMTVRQNSQLTIGISSLDSWSAMLFTLDVGRAVIFTKRHKWLVRGKLQACYVVLTCLKFLVENQSKFRLLIILT